MTYYSSVPAAIGALVAAFRTSTGLGLAGVPVRDGPELVSGTDPEAVAVGYTGDQNEDVVTGTASPEGLGGLPDRERYAVMCAAEVIDAGGDLPAARARVFELHAACGAAVAVDPKLGGAVLRASLGIGSLQQQADGRRDAGPDRVPGQHRRVHRPVTQFSRSMIASRSEPIAHCAKPKAPA